MRRAGRPIGAGSLVAAALLALALAAPGAADDAPSATGPLPEAFHDEVELVEGRVIRGRILEQSKDQVVIQPVADAGSARPPAPWTVRNEDLHEVRWAEQVAIGWAEVAIEKKDWARARAALNLAMRGDRLTADGRRARAAAARRLQAADLGEADEALARGGLEDLLRAYELYLRAIDLSAARKHSAEKGLGEAAERLAKARDALAVEVQAALERGKAAFDARDYETANDALVTAVDQARRLVAAVPGRSAEGEPEPGSPRAILAEAQYWLERCRAEKREMVYGDFERPETLEPVTARKDSERRLSQFIFESLVERTFDERFRPALAERWESSPDGLVWSFLLRRDAQFADGTPVTAQDVLATIEALTHEKTENRDPVFADAVRDVLVEGTRRVSVKLARPYYLPLSLFTFKVLPRARLGDRAVRRDHPFASDPLGSGPFVYREGLGSRLIRLGRNDSFQPPEGERRRRRDEPPPAPRPLLNGVALRTYADRNAARNDLEKGSTHLLAELRPLDVDFFSRQRGFRVVRYRSRTISFLAFNHRHPLLAVKEVRQAIARAIDREVILEQYFNAANLQKGREGLAHALITGPYPRGSWAYDEKVEGYPYDLEEAENTLKRVVLTLGYRREGDYWEKEGEPLELTIKFGSAERAVEQAVNYIRKNLRRIGIRARLAKKSELDLQQEVVREQDFEIVYWEHSFHGSPDPLPLFDSRRTAKGGTNFSGYVSPALMERFAAIQRSSDAREILRLTHEIHRTTSEECVFAFLWQLDRYAAHVSHLKGVRVHPYLLFDRPEEWKLVREAGK